MKQSGCLGFHLRIGDRHDMSEHQRNPRSPRPQGRILRRASQCKQIFRRLLILLFIDLFERFLQLRHAGGDNRDRLRLHHLVLHSLLISRSKPGHYHSSHRPKHDNRCRPYGPSGKLAPYRALLSDLLLCQDLLHLVDLLEQFIIIARSSGRVKLRHVIRQITQCGLQIRTLCSKRGLLLLAFQQGRHRINRSLKCFYPAQQIFERHAQRIDICAHILRLALQSLRRHVVGSGPNDLLLVVG